jgi:flagellar biosynthesis protein FliR
MRRLSFRRLIVRQVMPSLPCLPTAEADEIMERHVAAFEERHRRATGIAMALSFFFVITFVRNGVRGWFPQLPPLAVGLVLGILLGLVYLLVIGLIVRRSVLAEVWARGRCIGCGYDLRASPDRCPECGAVPEGAEA